MVEGDDSKNVPTVFQFIADFIDGVTGCCHQATLTTGHTANANLICSLLFDKSKADDVTEICEGM